MAFIGMLRCEVTKLKPHQLILQPRQVEIICEVAAQVTAVIGSSSSSIVVVNNMMENNRCRKDLIQLEGAIMREGRAERKNSSNIRKRETCWDSKKLSSQKLKLKERCSVIRRSI